MVNKKIALITGASRGIGAEIARTLALDGYHCIIDYNKSESEAVKVLNEITQNGSSAEIYKCDVSNSLEVQKMYDYIKKCYGKLDLVVNNAGISITKIFQDVTDEEWNEILATNLSSVFYSCREAVKLMLNNGGKIINISSMWGIVGASMEVQYSATKAGVIGLSKALAKEVATSNILVNVIAPGAIDTNMLSNYTSEDRDLIKGDIPLGEIGKPKDIANMVSFLANDKANYITGQVFSVDGGMII